MTRGLLPEHIGPLVDRLRAGDHQAVSLPDVAALTEVLMRSLESYFKSIDLTLYQECQSLADYIDDARSEISSLSPDHSDDAGIPRAGLELAAIVEQTESATNTIMESAEEIMDADPADAEAYSTTINDAVMKIFEACSFQDITGQRISKVVSTLEHVEDRVGRLINILGVMDGNKPEEDSAAEIDEDKALLNGPALDGEGIDQSEIDALLNGKTDDMALEIDDLEPNEPEQVTDETEEASTEPESVVDKTEEAAAEPEPVAEVSEKATADDIDFMFAGSSDGAEENNEAEVEVAVKAEEPAAEVEVVEEQAPKPEKEPNLIEQAKERKAKAQAEKKAKAKPPKPVEYEQDAKAGLDPKPSENTTQSDIDALFS
jgi:chemotaxis regulatin CheY-phosphate phosphatase CheZ